MNSKIIISIILVVLAAAVIFAQDYLSKPLEEGTPFNVEEEIGEEQAEEETLKETLLTKEGFEITMPPGWQEIPDIIGALVMVIDAQEEIVNEDIDFRTNLTIKKDDLGEYETLNSLQEYIESIKTSLIQAISVIEFTDEKEGTIGDNDASFIECESTIDQVDFKTLLVFVEESNGIVWGLSFNTFQESWVTYRNTFYQMAESFKPEEKNEG